MRQIIKVNNVTMKFNLSKEKIDSIKEFIIHLAKGKLMYQEFLALKNVSFSINKGDIVGLIGLNGAGKSTILKLISGILKPSEGAIEVLGSISPLIELGAGFDYDLTARENIFLNGAVLGHTKKVIKEKLRDIISFAELEDFIDVPIKNYSSGMVARLGFSIATFAKPDILIIDEILSVGDIQFQEKCENRINEMMASGTTVIIVSHSLNQIRRLCKKVIWLEHGKVIMNAEAKEVCNRYEQKSLH